MTITCPIACATCPIACFQYYKRSRGATGILLKKMKSTLFTVIGLLSMALNVQAGCPVNGCGAGKYCDCPSGRDCRSVGKCKDKELGGTRCTLGNHCKSGSCQNGLCRCKTTGPDGCISGNYCDSDEKCQKKKKSNAECEEDYECKSNDCKFSVQLCRDYPTDCEYVYKCK